MTGQILGIEEVNAYQESVPGAPDACAYMYHVAVHTSQKKSNTFIYVPARQVIASMPVREFEIINNQKYEF